MALPRHPRDVKRINEGCANHSLDSVRYFLNATNQELLAWSIQTLMAAAGQAKQQKNPGAVVACIKQLDWMTGLGINSISGHKGHR